MAIGAPAWAAPRVALLAPGLSATDVELTRAGLEASGVAVRVVDTAELPLVGAPAEEAAVRSQAEAALAEAHATFVATRFAAARATATAAEQRARRWGGAPEMARLLAELALVSAQSGDDGALARAAGYAPALTLDAVRFSPTLRQAFAAAQARLRALPRVDVEVTSEPAGATLFVDGQELGRTPTRASLAPGQHALTLTLPGFATVAEVLDGSSGPVQRTLQALDDDARLAQLRVRLADQAGVSDEDLALAARRFACDAAVAVAGRPPRVYLAGPQLPATAFDKDSQPLSDLAAALGKYLQTQCALAHAPPERGRAAAPLSLAVKAGACVARVHAALRIDERALPERSAPVRAGAATITVADLPSSARPYNLQYRLWGESALGSRVGALGSESAPLRVLIDADRAPPRPPRRWYHKWWVWTIAGGVLAGAAVAIAVTVYRPPSEARFVGH